MLSSRASSRKPLTVPSLVSHCPAWISDCEACCCRSEAEDTQEIKTIPEKNTFPFWTKSSRPRQEQVVAEECDLIVFDQVWAERVGFGMGGNLPKPKGGWACCIPSIRPIRRRKSPKATSSRSCRKAAGFC